MGVGASCRSGGSGGRRGRVLAPSGLYLTTGKRPQMEDMVVICDPIVTRRDRSGNLVFVNDNTEVPEMRVGELAYPFGGGGAETRYYPRPNMAYVDDPAVPNVRLFAVFDGHGGPSTAQYLRDHLAPYLVANPLFMSEPARALRDTIVRIDEEVCALQRVNGKEPDGSTAVVAIVREWADPGRADDLIVANVGDSRAYLRRGTGTVALTLDHTPTRLDEAERVRKSGGTIRGGRVLSPPTALSLGGFHALAVTRAVGDTPFKPSTGIPLLGIVTAEPEISVISLDMENDMFILLASDGVWGVCNGPEALDLAWDVAKGQGATRASEAVVEAAVRYGGSTDNTSVVFAWVGAGRGGGGK